GSRWPSWMGQGTGCRGNTQDTSRWPSLLPCTLTAHASQKTNVIQVSLQKSSLAVHLVDHQTVPVLPIDPGTPQVQHPRRRVERGAGDPAVGVVALVREEEAERGEVGRQQFGGRRLHVPRVHLPLQHLAEVVRVEDLQLGVPALVVQGRTLVV